jgi:hypothetical protein
MPVEKVELVNKGYMLRRDQADEIERLRDERPGAALSDIVRDVIDAGLPAYRERQRLIRSLDQARGGA